MCTSEAAIMNAGLNANSTIIASGAALSEWSAQTESFINISAKNNFSDSYATLNADIKSALSDIAASLIAMKIIAYDMSGYTSRDEAQTMLDVNRDFAMRGIELLKEKGKDFVNYMKGA